MSPHKLLQEATAEEISNLFDVQMEKQQEKAWVKAITLTSKDGQKTQARLFWNDDDGYSFVVDEPVSPELWQLVNRPEFEYVLDSMTNEDSLYNIVGLVRRYNNSVVYDHPLKPSAEATLDLISVHLRKLGHSV